MIGGRLKAKLLMLWWGEIPLGRAFWVYLVGGWFALTFGFILLIFLVYILFILWLGADAALRLSHFMRPFAGVFGLMFVSYLAFAFVGVWQSANRYISSRPYPIAPFLAALAKIVIIIWGAYVLFALQQKLPLIMAFITD